MLNFELFSQNFCRKNLSKLSTKFFFSLNIKSTTLPLTSLTYFNKFDYIFDETSGNLNKNNANQSQYSQKLNIDKSL